MRRSHGGADLFHGEAAHVQCEENERVPALVLCGCDVQVIVAPAFEDWLEPRIEHEHIVFARQLAEGAYRYLELLVAMNTEPPSTAA